MLDITGPDCAVMCNLINTYIRNDREQEEDKRELGGWNCKRRRTVEAAYDQSVGSREAEGDNGRRRTANEGPE